MPWHTMLVLGGIGSGRRAYAETVLAGTGEAASRLRRISDPPAGTSGLAGLAGTLASAGADELLLVEELTAWLPADIETTLSDLDALRAAIAGCPARVVLVGAEVGLQTAPSSAANRRLADALGALNQAMATVADAVVLVIAGLPTWLKGTPPGVAAPPAATAAPATLAPAAAATADRPGPDLSDLSGLPLPDDDACRTALEQLPGKGAGLGALAAVVEFAAGCRADPRPGPWQKVRVLVVHGDHPGAAAAGQTGATGRADAIRAGTAPLAQLAARAGASLQIAETAAAGPIEVGAVMAAAQVDEALAHGWRLADHAADEGVDLLVLASIGDGAETAATAVTTLLIPGAEPTGLLGRVHTADGTIDDAAWMRRAAAVRDAVRRVRQAPRGSARLWLAELGGPDLAVATGILIGAASRRTPVLLSGPLGAAAGLLARNLAPASRRWLLLPDTGRHPLVIRAAEALSLTPLLDLRLDLGEGTAALAALPLLQTALSLSPIVATVRPEPDSGGVSPRSAG